jgi:hypothetical protein
MEKKLLYIVILILAFAIGSPACKKDGDTTPPVNTMNGYDPYTDCVGTPYTDAGATATDDTDGDLTDQINTTIQVDVSQEGEGTVTYEVSDAAGNSTTVVRRVIVIFCK